MKSIPTGIYRVTASYNNADKTFARDTEIKMILETNRGQIETIDEENGERYITAVFSLDLLDVEKAVSALWAAGIANNMDDTVFGDDFDEFVGCREDANCSRDPNAFRLDAFYRGRAEAEIITLIEGFGGQIIDDPATKFDGYISGIFGNEADLVKASLVCAFFGIKTKPNQFRSQ